ncbi:hypothetical protein [Amycolatopsis albispora]|uniref:Uncharacterized protein n=1 Tax=Amycolatopsis albispora TaxID=1804986 RepID=A0A344L8U2_9PSEU|nr:hypothetical protein [Amycolatopsis albispora]AXB44466.1 hypothetical protein A4R43_19725 [Amycolatopsis albispora]
MRVSRAGDLVVGEWPRRPESAARLVVSGAVLAWDVLADSPIPAARVHDPELASEWLWEIYGRATKDILAGATEVTVPVGGDWRVRVACRAVAQLNWAETWWPAGVPALHLATLRAERAIQLSIVEHLLDESGAVIRALAALTPGVHPELLDRLVVLAENYGVTLPAGIVRAPAAAGPRPSIVDWTRLPEVPSPRRPGARQAELVAYALSRVGSAAATLTERTAASS